MRAHRIILFGVGCIVALFATLHVIQSQLDAAEIEPLDTRHGVATYYRNKVKAFQRLARTPEEVRIAFLGDSMVISYPPGLEVPTQLQRNLDLRARGNPRIRVFNLALAGTGSFDYYFLADLIGKIEPDLVIISFGMASPGRAFRAAFSRPELAGWIEGGRIAEAALLPMNWIGLTLDKILFYTTIIRLGGFERWIEIAEEQTRVEVARGEIEKHLAVEGRDGKTPEDIHNGRWRFYSLKRNNFGMKKRHSKYGMERNLGAALSGVRPDDPTLVALGATIRTFRRKNIDTLVYLSPINWQHVETLGMLDEEALARSVQSIRGVVEGNGGDFLDLLRIFPDDHFRDQAGHFVHEGKINGPRRLAAQLAPTVMKLARREAREKR